MREGYDGAIAATLTLSQNTSSIYAASEACVIAVSDTFLVTMRPLVTWSSTTLFAVFGDLSGDKNPHHSDLTACSATPIPSMLHLHHTVHVHSVLF